MDSLGTDVIIGQALRLAQANIALLPTMHRNEFRELILSIMTDILRKCPDVPRFKTMRFNNQHGGYLLIRQVHLTDDQITRVDNDYAEREAWVALYKCTEEYQNTMRNGTAAQILECEQRCLLKRGYITLNDEDEPIEQFAFIRDAVVERVWHTHM